MYTRFENLLEQGAAKWDAALLTDAITDKEVDIVVSAIPADAAKIHVVIDHDTPSGTVAVAAKQKKLRDFARANNTAYKYGAGIGYHLLMEQGIKRGDVVISCGRHVSVVGAVGAVGFALTPEQMKAALETGEFAVPEAKFETYSFEGNLPEFTSAKDLALGLVKNKEFNGKLVAIFAPQMSFAEKSVFLSLISESGAVSVFFTESKCDSAKVIDLGETKRLAVLPGDFSEIVPAARIDGVRVSQVFIGGCAGGTIEALRAAAEIWRGKRISKYVRTIVAPATTSVYNQAIEEGLVEVFLDANVLIMNQGCSACWAHSQGRCDENEVFASTGCINSANWAGKNNNGIYIVSPEDAARAALTGNLYEN